MGKSVEKKTLAGEKTTEAEKTTYHVRYGVRADRGAAKSSLPYKGSIYPFQG